MILDLQRKVMRGGKGRDGREEWMVVSCSKLNREEGGGSQKSKTSGMSGVREKCIYVKPIRKLKQG